MSVIAVGMSVVLSTSSVWAATADPKEEEQGKTQTVYVTADSDGNGEQVIVSNWLKNTNGAQTLTDKSQLSGITNVKGDETFTQSGDTITWQAGGKDIYYQGTSSKRLPVAVKVSYFLDGKEISAEDLAGKSGEVTIQIQYINRTQGEDFVPFLMMTGMILPTDTFSNVQVTGGKVISDGQNNIVVGMGFPGLSEALGLQDIDELQEYEIPESVEITAKAENFSLALTATVATTGTLSDLGIGDKDGAAQLTAGAAQLVDGADALSSGIAQLASGAGELKSGTAQLAAGGTQLVDGAAQLADGSKTLADGMKEFKEEGIQKLTDLLGDKLGDVLDRLQSVIDADASYHAFDGDSADNTGNVKFIIETAGIGE